MPNGITLFKLQAVLAWEFSTVNQGAMIFRAPRGFGKTFAGFACCTNIATIGPKDTPKLTGCAVIATTSNTVSVWLNHAEKLGWYNADPEKSGVLVYLSIRKRHNDYLKTEITTPGSTSVKNRKHLIIITSDTNLWNACTLCQRFQTDQQRVIIVDEANISRKQVVAIQSFISTSDNTMLQNLFHRELLMSADKVVPTEVGISSELVKRSVRVVDTGVLPKIKWNFTPIPNVNSNQPILDILSKTIKAGTKTLFIASEKENSYIESTDIFNRIKVFHLRKGIKTIDNFNKYDGKAVLLVNTNQNEGINVQGADSIIIFRPRTMNTVRCTQSIGRVVRRGNENKKVNVYMFCRNDYEFLWSTYVRCYFNDDLWRYDYKRLPTEDYLNKAAGLIRVLGSFPETVEEMDGAIIFADYGTLGVTAQEIINDWKVRIDYDRSVLNESIIRNMVGTNYKTQRRTNEFSQPYLENE